ncbi:uncharacterized protein METZ01_LOCUS83255, partial [marine metagenome]
MTIQNIFHLEGKVALVTGASSGLGRHFSKTLSSAGAEVILASRNTKKLQSLKDELKHKSHVINLNVNLNESVMQLMNEIERKKLKVDILVNNAGISDPKKFKELTEESWLNIIETNLNGAYRVAKVIADLMLKQGDGGSIINIASILGIRVGLNLTSYAAAKAALIQLTKSMALELA